MSALGAGQTVDLLKAEIPDFIASTVLPPNNLDLSPVDYTVRSVMQEKVDNIESKTACCFCCIVSA